MTTDSTVLPIFTKIEHQPNPAAESAFTAEVNKLLASGKRSVDTFGQDFRKTLDGALSIGRNQSGTLDLGIPQLKAAAEAQRLRAEAANELFRAQLRLAQAAGFQNEALNREKDAAHQVALAEREAAEGALAHAVAAERLQAELNRQTGAIRAMLPANDNLRQINRAMGAGFQQAGFQVSDFFVQVGGGTSAVRAMSQQLPQLTQAIALMGMGAEESAGKFGAFARFMGGPWGAAITVGASVLGVLAQKFLETDDAIKKVEFSTTNLSDAQSILGNIYDTNTGKVEKYTDATLALARAQAVALQIEAQRAKMQAEKDMSALQQPTVSVQGSMMGLGVRNYLGPQADVISAFRDNTLSITEAERGLRSLLRTGLITADMYEKAAKAVTDFGMAQDNIIRGDQLEDALGGNTSAISKFLKPTRGGGPKADNTADDLAKLKEFAEDAGAKIAGISDRFSEIPPAVAEANRATRELDKTIADLQDKRPPGFEQMIEDAQAAKDTIQEALVRPYEELQQASDRRLEIERLITAGRVDEAEATQIIWDLESRLGPITEARKAAILDMVTYERQQTEELKRQQDVQNDYLQATRSLRSELEGMFQGEKPQFGRIFRELKAKTSVEALFGESLRQLDEWVKNGPVEDSVTYMAKQTNRAGEEALAFADALHRATQAVATGSAVGGSNAPMTFAEAFDPYAVAAITGKPLDVLVTGRRPANDNLPAGQRSVFQLSPEEYFQRAAKALMTPLLGPLEQIGGEKFASQVTSVLGSTLYGYTTAGPVGGILGGLKGVADEFAKSGDEAAKGISEALGAMGAGAELGAQTAAIAKALGFKKYSTTGAEIGGALGTYFGPVGAIVGSIAGGVFGSFFKKAHQTYADFGELGAGQFKLGGGDKYSDEANSLAKSVLDGLNKLSDAFGSDLDNFALKIGVRDGHVMVDPTGNGNFKNGIDFGEDTAAAIAYAIQDAIKDGALHLSASITNLLTKENSDLDAQLQKALDFQSVFDRLKELKDPVGSAVDGVEKEFDRLRKIFQEAGASTEEYAQLEELYQLERTKAIEEAVKALNGTLESLYSDLTVNNSTLSLREREAQAQTEYDALAARVRAGDTTAYDAYAEASRTLLDIERQIYGSQEQFFELQDNITQLTKATIDANKAQAASASDLATGGSAVPQQDNAGVISALKDGNAITGAVNQNIIALNRGQADTNARLDRIASLLGGGSTTAAAKVSNF